MNIVSTSVQQFIIPKMSEISNDVSLFFQKLQKFEARFVLISTLIVITSELILPLIIEIVFGSKYNEAIPLLRVMIIGWYIQSFYALKGVAFLSLGQMKYISYSSLYIFLVSVPLMYWLNIKFGAIGASMSYVLQNGISYLILFLFLKRLKKEVINNITDL
jgi:O-antigen/teichoic acid export membrane protein